MVLEVEAEGRRTRAHPTRTVSSTPVEVARAGTPGPQLVAWLESATDRGGSVPTSTYLLRRLEAAVRSDDRVCPVGTRTVAVVFGSSVTDVAPMELGRRLVRAATDRADTGSVPVSVGLAASGGTTDPGATARAAAAGQQAARTRLARNLSRADACVVAFDHVVELKGPSGLDGVAPVPAGATPLEGGLRRRRLAIVQAGSFQWSGEPGVPPHRSSKAERVRLLVVDPRPGLAGQPGLAALAVAGLAEHRGFEAAATTVGPDGRLVASDGRAAADVLVIMLTGIRAGEPGHGDFDGWTVSAGLAEAYVAAGARVLAVDAGAGFAALAGCAAHGATPLFDLDQLYDELGLVEPHHNGADGRPAADGPGRLPQPLAALAQLTSSERRVLHRLMAGCSAQDIAQQLVVSVTTVRSHIRSILRKLNVKSQLAAVAIANGNDPARVSDSAGS